MTIYSIIGGLDIEEGDNRMGTMAEEEGMHELMETEGLIKCTSLRTETTLSEIKRRRELRQKRGEGELKELAENRGKGNRAVVRRHGRVTFLEYRNDLSGTPERRDIRPTVTKSEEQGKEGSNQVGNRLEHFSTKMVGTRSFAGRKLANVHAQERRRERRRIGTRGIRGSIEWQRGRGDRKTGNGRTDSRKERTIVNRGEVRGHGDNSGSGTVGVREGGGGRVAALEVLDLRGSLREVRLKQGTESTPRSTFGAGNFKTERGKSILIGRPASNLVNTKRTTPTTVTSIT